MSRRLTTDGSNSPDVFLVRFRLVRGGWARPDAADVRRRGVGRAEHRRRRRRGFGFSRRTSGASAGGLSLAGAPCGSSLNSNACASISNVSPGSRIVQPPLMPSLAMTVSRVFRCSIRWPSRTQMRASSWAISSMRTAHDDAEPMLTGFGPTSNSLPEVESPTDDQQPHRLADLLGLRLRDRFQDLGRRRADRSVRGRPRRDPLFGRDEIRSACRADA